MQLIYIYSSEFKSEEKGFHFSGKYKVKAGKKKGRFYIEVKKKEIDLDEFLYGKNVKISAIIGDNGTGKSTMLDMIRFLQKDNWYEIFGEGFALWEYGGRLYVQKRNGDKIECQNNSIELEDLQNVNDIIATIYYSDLLESKYVLSEDRQNFVGEQFFDISTSYSLLFRNHDVRSENILEDIFDCENRKMFALCKVLLEKKVTISEEFHIPSKVNIILKRVRIHKVEEVYKNNSNDNYINALSIRLREIEPSDICLANIHEYVIHILLICLLENIVNLNIGGDDYNEINNIVKDIYGNELESLTFETLKNRIEDDFNNILGTLSNRFDMKQVEDYRKFKDLFPRSFEWNKKQDKNSDIGFFSFYLGKETILDETTLDDIIALYDTYLKIKGNCEFLSIDWGMSSGECNMFSMFARINSAMKDIEEKKYKNVLLLMDEIDVAFHPKWQQEIIFKLSRFLNDMYPNVTFQVILTTHSPVVLSDIPASNVINLNTSENSSQTFAANIASLYYSTLMMEDGSIGKVSQKCITKLFKVMNEFLEKKESNSLREERQNEFVELIKEQFDLEDAVNCNIVHYDENRSSKLVLIRSFKKCIDTIGEDIWRMKLQELFARCEVLPQETEDDVQALVEQLRTKMTEEELKAQLREVRDKYDSNK